MHRLLAFGAVFAALALSGCIAAPPPDKALIVARVVQAQADNTAKSKPKERPGPPRKPVNPR